jgi:hypothetical protein
MGASGGDAGLLRRHDLYIAEMRDSANQENIMKTTIKYIAPWLAAAAIGGAIALAPIASANTDPAVPYGTDPHSPYVLGYHVSNHDEANTTNGFVDAPF